MLWSSQELVYNQILHRNSTLQESLPLRANLARSLDSLDSHIYKMRCTWPAVLTKIRLPLLSYEKSSISSERVQNHLINRSEQYAMWIMEWIISAMLTLRCKQQYYGCVALPRQTGLVYFDLCCLVLWKDFNPRERWPWPVHDQLTMLSSSVQFSIGSGIGGGSCQTSKLRSYLEADWLHCVSHENSAWNQES